MPLKVTRSYKTHHGSLRGPDRFPYVGVSFHATGHCEIMVLFYGPNRGVVLEPRNSELPPKEWLESREWHENNFFALAEPITIENVVTEDS